MTSPFVAFLRLHRNGLSAFTFLVAAAMLMVAVKTHSQGWGLVNGLFLDVFVPAQELLRAPVDAYVKVQRRVIQWVRLDEENRALRAELAQLRPHLAQFEELVEENRRLHALLAMPLDPLLRTVTARVMGDSSQAFSRSYVINAGQRHGVTLEVPVLGQNGLVGRVVQVGEHGALVLSLLDVNSRVPVLDQRSRVQAVVSGMNGPLLQVKYVAKGADVRPDDVLVTSGLGAPFPKGLIVGRVVEVEPNGVDLFQNVLVQPAVDFDRLEEVRLLVPSDAARAQ